jgi:DNA-directed RNA polymerase specialized sigma24 family protein
MDREATEALDDALLRSYLLGEATAREDEERLLRALFSGADGLERLEVAEDDLLDACARGELPEGLQQRALARLQAIPGGRARLAVACGLVTLADGLGATAPSPRRLRWPFRRKLKLKQLDARPVTDLDLTGRLRERTDFPRERTGRPTELAGVPSGLTFEQFETFLAHLAPDREHAGTRYKDIHRRLVGLFAWCESPEDVADEAINRVARRLAQSTELQVENSFAYFSGVAHHVAQEMLRERERERRAAVEAASITAREPEPELKTDACYACLSNCLARLPVDQRRLILEYYVDGHGSRARHRKRMAHELRIGLNALRIRACRIRRQLVMCCTRCMAESERARGGAQQ